MGIFYLSGMDYRIKKVGDDWEFLPKKERDEKREYERLLNKINQREKKIESDLEKIKELKKELRKWKSDRTKGYHKMVKYHKKFLPSFSTFLGSEDDGNPQWGMWVSIGGKRKYLYMGTVSEVSYHLDLLEKKLPHYNKNNTFEDGGVGYYSSLKPTNETIHKELLSDDDEVKSYKKEDDDLVLIRTKIESYVCDVIKKKMLGILKKDGNLDRFFDKKYKLKGVDILYGLYKKTPHYTPPQKEREKKKGGTLHPIKVGKMRNW